MSNYPPKPSQPMDSMTPGCNHPHLPEGWSPEWGWGHNPAQPGPCGPGHDRGPCGPSGPGCGAPPPPPMPPAPYPGFGCIPPVPTVLEGSSLYEAICIQAERTNQCINQWNQISGECFKTLSKVVNAARMNDVYYNECEVKFTKGYSEEEGCAYSLVTKEAVDSHGRPIVVQLGLPFNNSTNSGLKEDIFNMSYLKSANVIMTAVPVTQDKWYGPAMFCGGSMPGDPEENGFVYGFSKSGMLKYFSADVGDIGLMQNAMENVIGGCTPIISEGAILSDARLLNSKGAITAIGQNAANGKVYFFDCSAQDQPGMTGHGVAKILSGFGCTCAVITSFIPADNQSISNGMLYMGQMCENPQGGIVPENLAYWYISKKACFSNDFEETIANLVQTTGQNAWRNYLFGVEVKLLSERVTQNAKDIAAEIERAQAAEETLQENINKEQARAEAAEEVLQDNINKEQARAENAERTLQANIDAEQNRAEGAEAQLREQIANEVKRATEAEELLQDNIEKETQRAQTAEENLQTALNNEVNRATTREEEIQAALDAEIKARIEADNDLINAIEQETLARKAADQAILNTLDNEVQKLTGAIQDETRRAEAAEKTLTDNLQFEVERAQDAEAKLKEDIDAESQRAQDAEKTISDAVADNQKAINDEVQRAQQAEAQLKDEINELPENIKDQITAGTLELPYLPLTGGTVTGHVMFPSPSGQVEIGSGTVNASVVEIAPSQGSAVSISSPNDTTLHLNAFDGLGVLLDGVRYPTNDNDAANKEYVDQMIREAIVSGEYLPISGGVMTGPINFPKADANGTSIGDDGLTAPEVKIDNPQMAPISIKSPDTVHLRLQSMEGSTLVTLGGIDTPAANDDAANKQYVDDAVAKATGGEGGVTPEYLQQNYVQKAGDTMTGTLTVQAGGKATDVSSTNVRTGTVTLKPSSDANPELTLENSANNRMVLTSSDGLDTYPILSGLGTPTSEHDAATKDYVDKAVAAGTGGDYLPTTGGTMTGDIVMEAPQSTLKFQSQMDEEAEVYLDGSQLAMHTQEGVIIQSVSETGLSLYDENGAAVGRAINGVNKIIGADGIVMEPNGPVSINTPLMMGGNKITTVAAPTTAQDAANKQYVDTQVNTRLPLSGGTLSGVLNMNGNKISNVGLPGNNTDVATKQYVDQNNKFVSSRPMYVYKTGVAEGKGVTLFNLNLAGVSVVMVFFSSASVINYNCACSLPETGRTITMFPMYNEGSSNTFQYATVSVKRQSDNELVINRNAGANGTITVILI